MTSPNQTIAKQTSCVWNQRTKSRTLISRTHYCKEFVTSHFEYIAFFNYQSLNVKLLQTKLFKFVSIAMNKSAHYLYNTLRHYD